MISVFIPIVLFVLIVVYLVYQQSQSNKSKQVIKQYRQNVDKLQKINKIPKNQIDAKNQQNQEKEINNSNQATRQKKSIVIEDNKTKKDNQVIQQKLKRESVENGLDSKEIKDLNFILSILVKEISAKDLKDLFQQYYDRPSLKNQKQPNSEYVQQQNETLGNLIEKSEDVKSFKECLKMYLKMRQENVKILQQNYQNLAMLSLKLNSIECTAFLLKEMQQYQILVNRQILDQFLNLNYVQSKIRKFDHFDNDSLKLQKNPFYKLDQDDDQQGKNEIEKVKKIWKQLNLQSKSYEVPKQDKPIQENDSNFQFRKVYSKKT